MSKSIGKNDAKAKIYFLTTLVLLISCLRLLFSFQQVNSVVDQREEWLDQSILGHELRQNKTTYSLRDGPSTCDINSNLSDFLISKIGLGWVDNKGPPDWLEVMCPGVVSHYEKFPVFNVNPLFGGIPIPVQTTNYAAKSVCTMVVIKSIAASIQARLYLHAGSLLGAVLHGQPIPWDDDADMWLDYNKKDEFMNICYNYGNTTPILTHPIRVELHCYQSNKNAVKVWLQVESDIKLTPDRWQWYTPFVDLFFYVLESDRIQEVSPQGKRFKVSFSIKDYFPTRPYYFAGAYFIGPPISISRNRYKFQNCVMSGWPHRLETRIPTFNTCLDCQMLYNRFPFANDVSMKVNGGTDEIYLFPDIGGAAVDHVHTGIISTTIDQREEWFKEEASKGQNLTEQLLHLNRVDIDNKISPQDECHGRKLRVVVFNAERGRRWLESVDHLKHADVIILNEMDIGMARSDQQHTTRLLAYYLGMNYAWGLEFVELTLGDKSDRANLGPKEVNFHGLHGNAILSKCKISDGKIFRDPVGPYFANGRNHVNGGGLEKRLGGRMILLGRIKFNGTTIAIGSTHKLNGSRQDIKEYIQMTPSIIAGDQTPSMAKDLGLNVIVSNSTHYTWPASCTSFGKARGDNIFSSLEVVEEEYVVKPCSSFFGVNISLGDHSLTGATFQLPYWDSILP